MATLQADEGADVDVDTGMGMMNMTGMHTTSQQPYRDHTRLKLPSYPL
jgi:hypothetical protein